MMGGPDPSPEGYGPQGEQPDLVDYPRTPGWRDQPTSIEAAEAMAPKVDRLRDRVLAEIVKGARFGGLTADEAAVSLGLSPFSVRPRVTELLALGLIADSGLRHRNQSGRNAIVWVVVDPAATSQAQEKRPVKTKYERRKGR